MDDLPTRGALVVLKPGTLRWRCSCGHIGLTMSTLLMGTRGLEIDCELCGDRAFWFPREDSDDDAA